MPGFVFEELLRAGVPMVELDIVTPAACPDDEVAVYVGVTGIIDTGSPACIVNAGVLPDYFFQEGIPSKSFWTLSGSSRIADVWA